MTKASIHSYGDVRPVLDTAMERETLIYRLPSFGKAVNFRQRCYRYMAMQRRLAADRMGEMPGVAPPDPYPGLMIALREAGTTNPVRTKDQCPGACDVVFTHRQPEGTLLDEDGNPIELPTHDEEGGLDLD